MGEFLFSRKVNQITVIRPDFNRAYVALQIVAEMFQCLNNGQKFLIMDFIVSFCRLRGFGVVSYRMPMVKCIWLFQNCTYRKVACVGDEAIWFRWVGKCKERGSGKSSYEGVIRMLLCHCPVKRVVFLGEVEQGSCYGGVIFDKAMIKVAESQEGLDLFDVIRDKPVCDSSKFFQVHRDVAVRNDKSQVFDSGFCK